VPIRTILILAATAALATAATVQAARTSVPTVHRGQTITFSRPTPSHGACLLLVTWPDGSQWDSPVKSPELGKVTWRVHIPSRMQLGAASWLARCGVLWSQSGSWRVARALPR
jgi:hypothetical protein